MKLFSYLAAVFLVVVICAASSTVGQELVWKFTPGDTYQVTFDQSSDVVTDFRLIKRKLGTVVKLEMDWEVVSVTDSGVGTIRQIIRDIKMRMTTPTDAGVKEIVVDASVVNATGRSVAKDMWKQIEPLINSRFDVEISPTGAVGKVVVADESMEVIRNASGSMHLRKLFTPEGVQEMFGQSLMVLPKNEFTQGETWNSTREVETEVGGFTSEQTFTFEGDVDFEGEVLPRISVVTETSQSPGSDDENKLVDSNGSGALVFDPDLGNFVMSQFVTEMSFERPFRDDTIKTQINSSVTMRIQKN